MGRDIDLTDGGVASFLEDVANGVAAATLVAPADLTGAAGSYAMELLDELPAGTEFLQINAAGKWTTNAGSAGSLNAAYNNGGSGAGRVITADNGAVEINTPAASGNNVLRLTQADNQTCLFINKTGTGIGNAAHITDAGTGTSLLVVKTGPSGLAALISGDGASLSVGTLVDIQGDSANGALSVSSLDVGTNPVIHTSQFGAGVALHVDNSGNAFEAIVRLESGSGVTDAKLEFVQNAVRRWEIGYDQTALAFVLGRLSFANPSISVDDTTGLVNILQSLVVSRTTNNDCLFVTKTAVGAGALIVLANSGVGNDITADSWDVDANGNPSFGLNTDSLNHSVTIPCGTGQASSILMGVAGIGGTGLLTMQWAVDTDQLVFITGDVGTFVFRENGLVLGNPGGTYSGTNSLILQNGTAPTAGPSNSVVLYSEDVAASAELKVRDEANNITVLSPHTERHGHKLSEAHAWSFYSERDGKYIWVDMLRVVRLLEGLTGEELAFMGEAA